MLYALKQLLLNPLRCMSTVRALTATVSADANVSRRLRALASDIDDGKYSDTTQIAATLQLLAKQLLNSHPSGPAGQSYSATAEEACNVADAAAVDAATPAAADAAVVEQLECSYAAPAAEQQQQQQQQQSDDQPVSKKQKRASKSFDFSKYNQRYVALHVMYVGWKYHGFARQADTDNTIEGKLFPALRKVRLVPDDVEISSLDYSRCGRTDKGVSALGQVLALKLRSAAAAGDPLPAAAAELDYPSVINRALPDDIRVLGWADVQQDFNARFSALDREYKYFMVQDGSLDLSGMQEAAGYLVGDHDFRNFCKADVAQVRNFRRVVLSAVIEPAGVGCAEVNEVITLRIKGTAFLWHQVRCIAAVLLMVGRGQEKPSIIQQLLDINQFPCKPQYSMAAEEPLLLYSCGFSNLQWQRSEGLVAKNLAVLGSQLEQHLVAAALTSSTFEQLQQQWQELQQQQDVQQQEMSSTRHLRQNRNQQHQQHVIAETLAAAAAAAMSSSNSSRWLAPKPPHIPLHKRATEPSIEERFEKAGISLDLLNQKGLAAFHDA